MEEQQTKIADAPRVIQPQPPVKPPVALKEINMPKEEEKSTGKQLTVRGLEPEVLPPAPECSTCHSLAVFLQDDKKTLKCASCGREWQKA